MQWVALQRGGFLVQRHARIAAGAIRLSTAVVDIKVGQSRAVDKPKHLIALLEVFRQMASIIGRTAAQACGLRI